MAIETAGHFPVPSGREPVRDPPDGRPRLFILSDVRLFCDGLALALSHQPSVIVVGSSELSQSPEYIAQQRPDVILVDVAMPGSLSFCFRLRQALPDIKIVVFAIAELEEEFIACAEAGVSGYVSRKGSAEDVVVAVQHAVRGEMLCSGRMAALLFSRVGALAAKREGAAGEGTLTRREREIIALVAKGLSNKEIARVLRIKDATVKNHVHSILTKLQVPRRSDAAARIGRRVSKSVPLAEIVP